MDKEEAADVPASRYPDQWQHPDPAPRSGKVATGPDADKPAGIVRRRDSASIVLIQTRTLLILARGLISF